MAIAYRCKNCGAVWLAQAEDRYVHVCPPIEFIHPQKRPKTWNPRDERKVRRDGELVIRSEGAGVEEITDERRLRELSESLYHHLIGTRRPDRSGALLV